MKKAFYEIGSMLCFFFGIPFTWMCIGYFNNGYAALAFFANLVILTIFAVKCGELNDRF